MRVVAGRYAEMPNKKFSGGQGEVFGAVDSHREGENVAVKVFPGVDDPVYRIFFERSVSASRKLDHPHVAPILDSGYDEALGGYYLVMPWLATSLDVWQSQLADPPGWDDFATNIALPLTSALAHVHANNVLHRDIKPSNILLGPSGPQLADFALSKIKDQVAGATDATVFGATLAPWAPPDTASQGTARFDVYGLAATLLQCVTAWTISDFPHITKALAEVDATPEVRDLLARCLSTDPQDRPQDGQVLNAQLQAIQGRREQRWRKQKAIPLFLSGRARNDLEDASPMQHPEVTLGALLGTGTVVLPEFDKTSDGRSAFSSTEFKIIGDRAMVGVVLADGRFLVKWVTESNYEDLESRRNHSNAIQLDSRDYTWEVSLSAAFGLSARAANEFYMLYTAELDRLENRFAANGQDRLNSWSQLINAKETLERRLEEPIAYDVIERKGVETDIEATGPVTAAVVDQERLARNPEQPHAGIPVVVVHVDGTSLTVRAQRNGRGIPDNGELVRNRQMAKASIRRQKDALSALRDGASARASLRDLIMDPSTSRAPEPVSFTPRTPDLDPDKVVAVSHALGAPDFYLVEGPPGTGKTSFICEVVHQHLSARPDDKILVVSQMHVAIDNAISRIAKSGIDSVVRLSSQDDKVAPEALDLLLSNKLASWTAAVAQRAREGMRTLAARDGVNIDRLELALDAEEARAALAAYNIAAERLGERQAFDRLDNDDLSEDRAELLTEYLRAKDRLGDITTMLRTKAASQGTNCPESLTPETLSKMVEHLIGGDTSSTRLRELLRAQGDWLNALADEKASESLFLPTQSVIAGTCVGFLSNPRIKDMQFDLCIIDEASRATAVDLLIPMTRSKRWIMVGDPRQLPPTADEVFDHKDLVEEFELDVLTQKASLFDILLQEVPGECRTRLTTQHRMSRPIGELISQTFYGGDLIHDPAPVLDPRTVNDNDRLVWFCTSQLPGRHEEPRQFQGQSITNKTEARHVVSLVGNLNAEAMAGKWQRKDGEKVEVLILTGYTAQVREINHELARHSFDGLSISVHTVDAVQGREADVVVFSLVRSNATGDLGFLGGHNRGRINVAMSRAREALWIVGDSSFASTNAGPVNDALTNLKASARGRIEYL